MSEHTTTASEEVAILIEVQISPYDVVDLYERIGEVATHYCGDSFRMTTLGPTDGPPHPPPTASPASVDCHPETATRRSTTVAETAINDEWFLTVIECPACLSRFQSDELAKVQQRIESLMQENLDLRRANRANKSRWKNARRDFLDVKAERDALRDAYIVDVHASGGQIA